MADPKELTPWNAPATPQDFLGSAVTQEDVNNIVQTMLRSYNFPVGMGAGDQVFRTDKTKGIWLGAAAFTDAPFSVDMQGNAVVSSLVVSGGDLGGWTVISGYIYSLATGTPTSSPSNGIVLKSGSQSSMSVYEGTALRVKIGHLTGSVFGLLGYATDGSTKIFELSDTQQVIAGFAFTDTTLTATNLTLTSGGSNVANIAVGTGSTLAGMNAGASGTDIAFWAGATYANRATAPFRVNLQGDIVATSGTFNGSAIANQDIFGDGSDGDATISSNTSLTRDMFYDDLTIDSGFTLNPAGYRLHVKGTLTVNGTVGRVGNAGNNGGNASGTSAGSAGTGGAALASGSLSGAVAGTDGTAGAAGATSSGSTDLNGDAASNSSAGNNVVKSATSANGVQGGQGGGNESNTIGQTTNGSSSTRQGGNRATAGAAGTYSGTVYNVPKTAMAAWLLQDFFPSQDSIRGSAGSSGGSGGATGSRRASGGSSVTVGGAGGGGGAGSAGGLVGIYARTIVIGAAGVITAKGGAGGNGGNAAAGSGSGSYAAGGSCGGGGGGGGDGGLLVLVYSALTNGGSITVAGGAGGTGGTKADGASSGGFQSSTFGWWAGQDGANGSTGNSGLLVQLPV